MKRKNIIEIVKYIFSAGTSFALDLILFTIFNLIFKTFMGSFSIIAATFLARFLSSLYNYFINSRYVFKKYNKSSIYKYYALVVLQVIVSAVSVYTLNKVFTSTNATIIKFFVDIIIFIINYLIQKFYIFKS